MSDTSSKPSGLFDRIENSINNLLGNPPIDWDYRKFMKKAIKDSPQIRFDPSRETKLIQAYSVYAESKEKPARLDDMALEILRKQTVKLNKTDHTLSNNNSLKREAFKLALANIEFVSGASGNQTDLLLKQYYKEYFSPALDRKKIFTTDKISKDLAAWGIKSVVKQSASFAVSENAARTELLAGPAPDKLNKLLVLDNWSFDVSQPKVPSLAQTLSRFNAKADRSRDQVLNPDLGQSKTKENQL
jgi:hypothetical protein